MALLTSPTVSDLLRETRLMLNQPDASSSFWSDEELIRYFNNGTRQYFLVLNEVAEGQFDAVANLDIVAGQETVALPSDMFEVRAVYAAQSNKKQILQYFNNVSESFYTDSGTAINQYNPYYYFRGESLVLRPVPTFSQVGGLQVEYTAFPQTMITGGDTLTANISPIFRELVVMYAVYMAKIKESLVQGGNTYAAAERVLQDLFSRFKDSVASRSKYPQKIRIFSP